jgi:hypothetical protein
MQRGHAPVRAAGAGLEMVATSHGAVFAFDPARSGLLIR